MVHLYIVQYKVLNANIRALTSQAESPPPPPTLRYHEATALVLRPPDMNEEQPCWWGLGLQGPGSGQLRTCPNGTGYEDQA